MKYERKDSKKESDVFDEIFSEYSGWVGLVPASDPGYARSDSGNHGPRLVSFQAAVRMSGSVFICRYCRKDFVSKFGKFCSHCFRFQ